MAQQKLKIFKPLLLKIFIGVNVPLLILLVGFSFMMLRRESASENARFTRAGEMTLASIQSESLKLFSETDSLPHESRAEMKAQADYVQSLFQLQKVDILDPVHQMSLISGETYAQTADPVLRQAFAGLPDSLAAKREGKTFHLNLKGKALTKDAFVFGYIPFKHKSSPETLVLTAVFKTSYREVIQRTLSSLGGMLFLAVLAGIAISLHLSHQIVKPIQAINLACREMLGGRLGLEVEVKTGDELEFLAENFNQMSRSLMVMNRKAEDSNPLTQLPGNRQIMAELSKRIESRQKFVYIHIDIDHFKAYNDRYGLGRGDDVLRWTSETLKRTIAEDGSDNNFVGHQGGDDFVIIVEDESAERIGKKFCKNFDAGMKDYYEEETLKQGFFIGEDERDNSLTSNNTIKKHLIMSVSMAGISTRSAGIINADDILEMAVRVKKKAKQIPYSIILIEEIKS